MYAVTDAVVLLFQDWPQWNLWQNSQIPRTAMSELDAQLAHLQMATGAIKLIADQALTRVDLQMRLVSAPRSPPTYSPRVSPKAFNVHTTKTTRVSC